MQPRCRAHRLTPQGTGGAGASTATRARTCVHLCWSLRANQRVRTGQARTCAHARSSLADKCRTGRALSCTRTELHAHREALGKQQRDHWKKLLTLNSPHPSPRTLTCTYPCAHRPAAEKLIPEERKWTVVPP